MIRRTVATLVLLAACSSSAADAPDARSTPDATPGPLETKLPTSAQRSGDADTGYQYLLYGNFVSSGIPLATYQQIFGTSAEDLQRTGDSAGIPYNYNVITASNGVKVVVPQCLTCHAEHLMGTLVVGLGNNSNDYSTSELTTVNLADGYIKQQFGADSPEYAAFEPFGRGTKAIAPLILTDVQGVNPADKIFAVLSAHRDPNTLVWNDTPSSTVPTAVVPTDVPPWWNVKKKAALYYNGLGQGDRARLSSASGMLTLTDTTEAAEIDSHFPDLMAWLDTIQPPVYPFAIDQTKAAAGKTIFEATCSRCHGTYGAGGSYPQLLVSLEEIGTDSTLAKSYKANSAYSDWYNESWYGQGADAGKLNPQDGYVAPPLDGIWATAPYLHNGSVPSIAMMLQSTKRPTYWKRGFSNDDYDQTEMGWTYTTADTRTDYSFYDTTVLGYGNTGHTFGDALTDDERNAVLEYLKTL